MLDRHPINKLQVSIQDEARSKRDEYLQKLAAPPRDSWRNLTELNEIVTKMLADGGGRAPPIFSSVPTRRNEHPGRCSTGSRPLLTSASRRRRRSCRERLVDGPGVGHRPVPRWRDLPGRGNFDAARQAYRDALKAKPDLFEACYSLAVLEQESGNATAAHQWATRAVAIAPDDLSRTAAQSIATTVVGFAGCRQDRQARPP